LVADFPEAERAVLEPQGILSILLVPIMLHRRCWGFVGFDDCTRGRSWSESEAALLRAAAGALGGAFRRDRAEAAVRESEQRLRLVLEGSEQGFWDWNIGTGDVVFSPHWSAMLGYAQHEVSPRVEAWERLVHPEDLPKVMESIEAHLSGVTPYYQCEHRLLCRNGQWKWILDRGKVVQRDPAGNPLRACGTHSDISERKRSEHLLRVERDLGLALAASLTEPEVFARTLEAALRIEGFDGGACFEVDELDGSLRLVCHRGLDAAFVRSLARIPGHSETARVVASGRSAFGRWDELAPGGDPAPGSDELKTIAMVPTSKDGRVVACLCLGSRVSGPVPMPARQSLEAIAAHMTSALIRARAEAALSESWNNLQTMFDRLDDFVFILDERGRILHANPVVSARLGFEPWELLGKELLSLHAEESRDRAEALLRALVEGREAMAVLPLRSSRGTTIPVETRMTRGNWSGRPVWFGLSRDVTERVRAQDALEESEARIRAILHAIPDVLFRMDREGRFVDVVAKHPEELMMPADQIPGRHVQELLPPDLAARVCTALRRTLETGVLQSWEYQLPLPEGLQDYEARFVPLDADEVLILVRNITERKRAADHLMRTLAAERQLNVLRSHFASTVSHEFRTPLGAILGAVEMIEDFHDRLTPEKRAGYFRLVHQEIRRMTGMLEEVLMQGQLEAGRVAFKPAPIDPVDLIRRLVAEAQAAFPRHPPIDLVFRIADADMGARALDESLVRSMLGNLLSNAFKYSPDLTPVRLEVSARGAELVLEVGDRGIGIPDEDLSHIGAAFHRGRNVGHIKGTGVGIYIVMKCAELHGGRLDIEARPGGGTTCRLRLRGPTS
jgi:PAS domain S-box-containing protein